jgi:hypothetical protein
VSRFARQSPDACLRFAAQGAVGGSDNFLKEKSKSFVTTQPEMLSTAAGELANVGSAMSALNAAAAGLPGVTIIVVPPSPNQ